MNQRWLLEWKLPQNKETNMEAPVHSMSSLFAQLGLATGEGEISAFIQSHSPLPAAIALQDAPFWTTAQRSLLQSELCVDADWAGVIDELNVRLRA